MQYTVTIPAGCSSWVVTAGPGSTFYAFRHDCLSKDFVWAMQQYGKFTYSKPLIATIKEYTDCCVNIISAEGTGWVERELLDLTSEQRKTYDEWVAWEKAELVKKKAGEVARRKKQEADRQKREAEEDARTARLQTERRVETMKVRDACRGVYRGTADRKVSDLTVREEQQVRACQALGLYPPQ